MKKDDPYKFEQKKINHIFHYTSVFTDLQKIIRYGFAPSYCKEEIDSVKYLSPMVSFCNIPIAEVDRYMRYGKNGIGMSLEWAIRKGVNPVLYIHRGSPYKSLASANVLNAVPENPNANREYNFLLKSVTTQLLQNVKYWQTEYQGDIINTYQEREWRFVPKLNNELPIVDREMHPKEYDTLTDKKESPKPHLKNYTMDIESINDIRYIVVTSETQREKMIKTLSYRFGKDETSDALINGKLSILTASQIRNDF